MVSPVLLTTALFTGIAGKERCSANAMLESSGTLSEHHGLSTVHPNPC